MRAVVLCEGKTDAVLLSYLLGKVSGWEYTSDKKLWNIHADDRKNESAYWYKRGDDFILICGVGGKDCFGHFFEENVYQPILQAPKEMGVDKLVYMVDKDFDQIEDLEQKVVNDLALLCKHVKSGEWVQNEFEDEFGMNRALDVMALIVPNDTEGALENILLQAIAETEYDNNIVQKSKHFVDEIKEEAREYIKTYRLELKAKLSVVFAIRSPQKVFSVIDELIRSVEWEKYCDINQLFDPLLRL